MGSIGDFGEPSDWQVGAVRLLVMGSVLDRLGDPDAIGMDAIPKIAIVLRKLPFANWSWLSLDAMDLRSLYSNRIGHRNSFARCTDPVAIVVLQALQASLIAELLLARFLLGLSDHRWRIDRNPGAYRFCSPDRDSYPSR